MRTHFVPLLLTAGIASLAAAQPARDNTRIWIPVPDYSSREPPVSLAAPINVAPIYVAPIVPPAFRLLAEPAVQKEIGLTDAQKAAADSVRKNMAIPVRDLPLGKFGFVPADAFRDAVNQRTADFLATGLTKEQRLRLDQILFQLREKEFGPHLAFAMSARDLGLRPDQMDDARTLKALRVEEIAKTVTSGKRFDAVKLGVQATNGDTFEKMSEMLTRAQRERLKELRGSPFLALGSGDEPKPVPAIKAVEEKLNVAEEKVAVPVEPAPAPRQLAPKPNAGLYDLELKYLDKYEIGNELKLTDRQSGNIARAWLDFPRENPGGKVLAGKEPEAHEATEKILADVLTSTQRARFNEIMMQRRARVSPEAACTYPPTISALKLTPIQVQQLSSGKQLAAVLSKDQYSRYQLLLGAPFNLPVAWDDYLPDVVAAAAPPVRAVQTGLSSPYAQARDFLLLTNRLKLSAEQVKKLRDLAEDEPKIRELIQKELSLDDTPPVAGAGRALTAVNAVTEQYRATVEQQCWDVLDPPQQSLARKLFGRK